MKKERKVIHVYIHSDDLHYYFGSLVAMYSTLSSEAIGIQYQSIINYFKAKDTNVYMNAKCTIRKDVLRSQETKRGQSRKE